MVTMSIEGMDGIVEALRTAAPAEARAALRDALRGAGSEMVQAAKSLCPSQAVRQSLGIVLRYQKRKKRILAVLGPQYGYMVNDRVTVPGARGASGRRRMRSNMTPYARAAARISHLIEFGTRPHFMPPVVTSHRVVAGGFVNRVPIAPRRGWQHPGTAARPFMRPAWEGGKYRFIDAARARLREAADRIAAYGRYNKTKGRAT